MTSFTFCTTRFHAWATSSSLPEPFLVHLETFSIPINRLCFVTYQIWPNNTGTKIELKISFLSLLIVTTCNSRLKGKVKLHITYHCCCTITHLEKFSTETIAIIDKVIIFNKRILSLFCVFLSEKCFIFDWILVKFLFFVLVTHKMMILICCYIDIISDFILIYGFCIHLRFINLGLQSSDAAFLLFIDEILCDGFNNGLLLTRFKLFFWISTRECWCMSRIDSVLLVSNKFCNSFARDGE